MQDKVCLCPCTEESVRRECRGRRRGRSPRHPLSLPAIGMAEAHLCQYRPRWRWARSRRDWRFRQSKISRRHFRTGWPFLDGCGTAQPDCVDERGDRPAGGPQAQRVLSEQPSDVGTIEGGTAVNAIPESASARFDFRSTDPEQLVRLEVELHRAVEDVVLAANREAAKSEAKGARPTKPRPAPLVHFEVRKIGDRPAAALPQDARNSRSASRRRSPSWHPH